jgi:hypothetical protein
MSRAKKIGWGAVMAALCAGLSVAQQLARRGANATATAYANPNDTYVRLEGGLIIDEDTVRTARETAGHSVDFPPWKNSPGFDKDVFTYGTS